MPYFLLVKRLAPLGTGIRVCGGLFVFLNTERFTNSRIILAQGLLGTMFEILNIFKGI